MPIVFLLIVVFGYLLATVFSMAVIVITGIGLAEATIWVAGELDYQLPIDRPLIWLACIVFAWMSLMLLVCSYEPSFPSYLATEYGADRRNEELVREVASLRDTIQDVMHAVEAVEMKLPKPPKEYDPHLPFYDQ